MYPMTTYPSNSTREVIPAKDEVVSASEAIRFEWMYPSPLGDLPLLGEATCVAV